MCVFRFSQQHFDLVSERDVRQAREHVAAEIAPFLRELIMRAEEVLARDEREARALRSKVCISHLPWATQELAKNESQSQLHTAGSDDELKSPSMAALVADYELDEQRRELELLRKERLRLMERVQSL